MPTKNPRIAAYIPESLHSRFVDYMSRNHFDSESKAIAAILKTVLGDEVKAPAIDRLEMLESRIERLERRCAEC